MNYTDFTPLKAIYRESFQETITILEASFVLNEETILSTLRKEAIRINGRDYEIPREELCELLKEPRFEGVVKLKLKEIPNE